MPEIQPFLDVVFVLQIFLNRHIVYAGPVHIKEFALPGDG